MLVGKCLFGNNYHPTHVTSFWKYSIKTKSKLVLIAESFSIKCFKKSTLDTFHNIWAWRNSIKRDNCVIPTLYFKYSLKASTESYSNYRLKGFFVRTFSTTMAYAAGEKIFHSSEKNKQKQVREKDKMKTTLAEVFRTSLVVVSLFYGSWTIFTQIFSSIIPIGLSSVILCTLGIYLFRVPPPSPRLVENIIGKDLREEHQEGAYALKMVAHRGAGLDAPENTLAAFKMCKEKGCDFVEYDVTLTADKVPIVFHDETTGRMSETDLNVNKTLWKELQKLNLSDKHPFKDRFPVTNIPTFEQVVMQLLEDGIKMFIDIKDNNTEMVGVVTKMFDKYPKLYQMAIVTSFYPNILYLIRRKNPKIICSMAYRPFSFTYTAFSYAFGVGAPRTKNPVLHYLNYLYDILHCFLLTRVTYYLIGLSIILLHKDAADGSTIMQWKEKGVRPMVWTVNNPIEKQYFSKVLHITYLTDTFTAEASTHSIPS